MGANPFVRLHEWNSDQVILRLGVFLVLVVGAAFVDYLVCMITPDEWCGVVRVVEPAIPRTCGGSAERTQM